MFTFPIVAVRKVLVRVEPLPIKDILCPDDLHRLVRPHPVTVLAPDQVFGLQAFTAHVREDHMVAHLHAVVLWLDQPLTSGEHAALPAIGVEEHEFDTASQALLHDYETNPALCAT